MVVVVVVCVCVCGGGGGGGEPLHLSTYLCVFILEAVEMLKSYTLLPK